MAESIIKTLFKHLKRLAGQTVIVIFVATSLTACNQTHKGGDVSEPSVIAPMVSGVKVIKDFAYGKHKKQRMDIYVPENVHEAPIIMMMHGGGWTTGDKNGVPVNIVNRWAPKGFVVISVGTRLMPKADVYAQINDLAQSVVTTQKHAAEWGGDPAKLMLMGHSSGGTMVSVLAAKPSLVTALGGVRWLASFALDSSSLDIPRTMRLWSPDMFTYAYGETPENWLSASPINLLSSESIPMFIACSTQRPDGSCEQAELFVEEAKKFKLRTQIVQQNFDHGGVGFQLGLDPEYTNAAEVFMASLDSEVARRLSLPEH